jgi:hypothetical protein
MCTSPPALLVMLSFAVEVMLFFVLVVTGTFSPSISIAPSLPWP